MSSLLRLVAIKAHFRLIYPIKAVCANWLKTTIKIIHSRDHLYSYRSQVYYSFREQVWLFCLLTDFVVLFWTVAVGRWELDKDAIWWLHVKPQMPAFIFRCLEGSQPPLIICTPIQLEHIPNVWVVFAQINRTWKGRERTMCNYTIRPSNYL